MRLFFSWQSDIPENKRFLRNVLQKICDELDIEYSDDTRDEAGGEHVVDVLLRKISNSNIFVSDVTIVGKAINGDELSNSNVSYELGYAEAKLTRKNIIMIMNEEYGSFDQMPFDLGKRMITRYSSVKNIVSEPEKLRVKAELKRKIETLVQIGEQNLIGDLDAYEKTLIYWGVSAGDGFIRERKHQGISSIGHRVLCVGDGFFGSNMQYFYREYDQKESTLFRVALNKLKEKGFIIPADVIGGSLPFGDGGDLDWLITKEGEVAAASISQAEIMSIFSDEGK